MEDALKHSGIDRPVTAQSIMVLDFDTPLRRPFSDLVHVLGQTACLLVGEDRMATDGSATAGVRRLRSEGDAGLWSDRAVAQSVVVQVCGDPLMAGSMAS
jgi:hypothetical protein